MSLAALKFQDDKLRMIQLLGRLAVVCVAVVCKRSQLQRMVLMNRAKKLRQELAREGFCFPHTLQGLSKALGARQRINPLQGVILFGHTLNKRTWVDAEVTKGNVVRLQNHATEGLIY